LIERFATLVLDHLLDVSRKAFASGRISWSTPSINALPMCECALGRKRNRQSK
jgi:hypothetical protein